MNWEKIKNSLRNKDIPFEKNHKKDDCLLIPYKSDDYIIIHSRYLPFIKKDNPINFFGETPIVYKECYSYFNVFDKDCNYIMSVPTTRGTPMPMFLDKDNFILKKDDDFFYHYKKVSGAFIACTYFPNIYTRSILTEKGFLLIDKGLYNYKDGTIITFPYQFSLISENYEFNDLFKKWNVEKYQDLTDKIIAKINNENLLCIKTRVEHSIDDFSYGYDIIAFMDIKGLIVSDLFYMEDNIIKNLSITNKDLNKELNNLKVCCFERVIEMKNNSKPKDLSEEIIKKLGL